MAIATADFKRKSEEREIANITAATTPPQSSATAPLVVVAPKVLLHPHSHPNSEALHQLYLSLNAYEKTYSEPYQIPFSFKPKTDLHGILTQYFVHAMKKVRQKFDAYTYFFPRKFLQRTKSSDEFQYVVLYNPNNHKYPLSLRIGQMNHARLGLGNDYYDKFHQMPVIQEIKMALDALKQPKVNTAANPELTPNTTRRSISEYETYKEALKDHFIREMPRIILAGNIYNRGNKIEITDQSGGFYFEAQPNDPRCKIYDQAHCIAQIMKAVGFVDDIIVYNPINPIDMSKDPRLNGTVHSNHNGMSNSGNSSSDEKQRKELLLSAGGSAAAAVAKPVMQPATNIPDDATFSAATNLSAMTEAELALPPDDTQAPNIESILASFC